MKRFLLIVLASLAGTLAVYAQTIRDIDVRVVLQKDGSARVTQVWDANVVDGTEMYIPISNLDKMGISDFSVSENGLTFYNEGTRWDVDRSLSEKAGRCGIVKKSGSSYELCWGKGSYGDHVWTVEYTLSGLVQSFTDADGFNFMFVNKGMKPSPRHVKVTLVNATGGPEWTYDNTKVWGFGSYGDINVTNGQIVYESLEPFSYDSSAIMLVQFDKGLFEPEVTRDSTFEKLKDKAMKGSSYGENEKEETFMKWLFGIIFGGGLLAGLRAVVLQALGYKYKKSMYGKTKITDWWREAPMEGDLFASSYVLDHGWRFAGPSSSQNLIGAFFLRWILDGTVKVQQDPKNAKRVNLVFNPDAVFASDTEAALYRMATEASGGNLILEANEFERWSEKHYKQFLGWPDRTKSAGKSFLTGKGWLKGSGSTTGQGVTEACHVIEFKNFLEDFTLSKERGAAEVGLWKDYLVFAQLFGIADKVAKQFQKLFPKEFQEMAQNAGLDPNAMIRTINVTNGMSTSAINRATAKYTAGSVKGMGGHTSFGGGGGFSGGGFGGGSR